MKYFMNDYTFSFQYAYNFYSSVSVKIFDDPSDWNLHKWIFAVVFIILDFYKAKRPISNKTLGPQTVFLFWLS